VLGSDIRIAATLARANAAFVRIGSPPATSGPRACFHGSSAPHAPTTHVFDADEALRMGLVTDVVEDAACPDRTVAEAGLIAANRPMGMRTTKQVMRVALEMERRQAAIDLETGRR
jgi:enoyl-CoA hydratase